MIHIKKRQKPLTVSIDEEKTFDKIQHSFITEIHQSGYRGNISQHNKTEDLNRPFSEEAPTDGQHAMKRFFKSLTIQKKKSLTIREVKIETTVRYHCGYHQNVYKY